MALLLRCYWSLIEKSQPRSCLTTVASGGVNHLAFCFRRLWRRLFVYKKRSRINNCYIFLAIVLQIIFTFYPEISFYCLFYRVSRVLYYFLHFCGFAVLRGFSFYSFLQSQKRHPVTCHGADACRAWSHSGDSLWKTAEVEARRPLWWMCT